MLQITKPENGTFDLKRRRAAKRLFAFGLLAAALLAVAAPAAAQNTVPDAELSVKAEPGDEKVSLHFKEPDDGGSPIIRYEYRVKVATGSYPATWTRVPEFTGNVGATLELFVVVESLAGGTALANGTEYAFQVRAVNGVGAGMPDEDMATPQVNVPARYTLGPEQGIIERRPLAPAPRVPADQYVSLLGAINDPDGIDAARVGAARFTYEWEWIRVRTGVETVIAGAGSGDRGERTTEYVLTPADVGSQIKARVRYRDDRYNAEEFVTALFPASGTILPAAACAAPTYTGGAAEIWQDELKIEDIDHADATPNRYGVFGSRMFTAGSNTYEIDGIYRETVGADADKLSFGLADKDLTGTDKNQLILYVCDEAYPLIDATLLPTRHNYLWPDTDDWSTYLTRTVRLGRDAVAPTVTRARISGASLTVAFSEDLDGGSIPATAAFAVEVGGEPAELETGSTVVLGGDRVTLTLAEAPSSGSTITVAYTQPVAGRLRDRAQNEVSDFTRTVTRPIPPRPPTPPRQPPPPPPPVVPGAPASLVATAGDGEVALVWSPPKDDGRTAVTVYEYRYAAGGSVPEETLWQSAGLDLEQTVVDLTNGEQYAFEVRALNRVGAGEPRGAVATPVGAPGAPASLAATPGDGEVVLAWSAPEDDGGAPVTVYEYRYAAGSSVPEETLWQSAGLDLERTVVDFTNGQQYAFEVRALNRVGAGEALEALATPVGAPGAPASLTATAGEGEVALAWSPPVDDGGTSVTGYEYRYAAGAAIPVDTPWQSAGLNLEWKVTGLTDGQQYTFQVRVRNRVGPGEAQEALATPVGTPGAPASLAAMAGDGEVALAWSPPVDDGGTPITGYKFRYAAGAAVPVDTPWQSAGLNLGWTVAGLTNGQQYAFEVRARNLVGESEARTALATPVGAPDAPASLTATAGEGEVALAWSAPVDDGGTPVTGYEYRYAAGDAVPEETHWQEAEGDRTVTVTGLENETRYAFEVRARNRVGPGETLGTLALPLRLQVELFSSITAAEGEAIVVGVRRSGGLAFPAHAYIGVTDSAFPDVTVTEEGRDDGLGRHLLEFAPSVAEATVTVTVVFDGERRQNRVLTTTLDSAEVEVHGVSRAYKLVTPTLEIPVTEGDAALSVADARVHGKSAVLVFTVNMDRTRDVTVRVDYATEDGSAKAGEDYTPVTGTLTIAPGRREGTVNVRVLPALHVTGERMLTLTLSNARNAVIEDGAATGTIIRESELPKAWLARFGRTASDHAAQAISRRLEIGERETHVTVAGRRLENGLVGGLRSRSGGLASAALNVATKATSGLAASAARGAHPNGGAAWSEESGKFLPAAVLPDFGFRLPAVREVALGSSFYVEGGGKLEENGGNAWAAWGDVTATFFVAKAGDLGLNGDVVTGTMGLDRQWRKLLVGLALSRSGGDGAYGAGAGTITSTLTSVHPYMRVRLSERAQLWGTAGWGRGGLRLRPGRGAGIETDLSNAMAAVGGRALLRSVGATESSLEIALRSDLLWTRTSSEEARALAEATGTSSRGRLMLEGAGRVSGMGGVLRPNVEGGLRYDGGDAETGAGLEVAGGVDWGRGGLALRVKGRVLLAYADESYEEWGYGGSVIYGPGADGRGLRMRLGFRTGAAASGVQSLWGFENAAGLVRQSGMPFARRSDAEVGFGLGGGMLWYPYLASDATGQKRLGLKLSSGQSFDFGLAFGRIKDGTRPAKDTFVLRGDIRF